MKEGSYELSREYCPQLEIHTLKQTDREGIWQSMKKKHSLSVAICFYQRIQKNITKSGIDLKIEVRLEKNSSFFK